MGSAYESLSSWIGDGGPAKAAWALKYFQKKFGPQILSLDNITSYILYHSNPKSVIDAAKVAWRQAKKAQKLKEIDKKPLQVYLQNDSIKKIDKHCRCLKVDRSHFIESLISQFDQLSQTERKVIFAQIDKKHYEVELLKANSRLQNLTLKSESLAYPYEHPESIEEDAVNRSPGYSGRIY